MSVGEITSGSRRRTFTPTTWRQEVDVIVRDSLKQDILRLRIVSTFDLGVIADRVVTRRVTFDDQVRTVKQLGDRYQTVLELVKNETLSMAAGAWALEARERRGVDPELDQYDNRYVAIGPNGILGSGVTYDEAVANAGGCEDGLYVDFWETDGIVLTESK